MNRSTIAQEILGIRPRLDELGVAHCALFGSAARDRLGPESDIDILLTAKPDARIGLVKLGKIYNELVRRLGRDLDLVVEPVPEGRFKSAVTVERFGVF